MNLYSLEVFTNDDARNISVQFALRQIAFHPKDGKLSTRGKFTLVCSDNSVGMLID